MAIETLTKQLRYISKYKGIHYSLDHLYPILEKLGNPHLNLNKVVHIAGTNGKGSTLQFLNQICQEHGLSVGTYMSPHIECYTERIQLNHHFISESDFQLYFDRVFQISDGQLTEFECLTLMSFCYFADKQPDVVLYEVGLGGRLDTTNVIIPDCCVITSIAHDHEQFLGDTIEKIATEKAGIIKPGAPLITTLVNPVSVKAVFADTCKEKQVDCLFVEPLIELPSDTKLVGGHQLVNAAMAIEAAKQVISSFDYDKALLGLQHACHWGRYMTFKQNDQCVVVDAAHNEQSMSTLVANLKVDFPNHKLAFLLGLNKTKKTEALTRLIEPISTSIYYCEFDDTYAESFENVNTFLNGKVIPFSLTESLPEESLLVVTGSIYFLGEFKKKGLLY